MGNKRLEQRHVKSATFVKSAVWPKAYPDPEGYPRDRRRWSIKCREVKPH